MSKNLNGYAGRDQIVEMASLSRAYRDVEIDDMRFRLQSLTEGDVQRAYRACVGLDGETADSLKERTGLIKMMCVDAQGNRIFRDNDDELIESLPSSITAPLYVACQRHAVATEKKTEPVSS